MKRTELIDKYEKILRLKNYSPKTEKAYLHHLNLFLDYISKSKISSTDSKILIDYFDYLEHTRKFSYSAIKQSLASVRFLFLDVLKKEIDFDFFVKMKDQTAYPIS